MKTLIITGSPKKEGLCAELAEIALEAAKKAGADAEVLRVHDCRLQPCRMCGDGWGSCREKHVCAFGGDGLTELQSKLAEADSFVLLTPVYWGGLSEELKSFLDRIRRCVPLSRKCRFMTCITCFKQDGDSESGSRSLRPQSGRSAIR